MALLPVATGAKEADCHQCQAFAPCCAECQGGALLADFLRGIPQADQTSPQHRPFASPD